MHTDARVRILKSFLMWTRAGFCVFSHDGADPVVQCRFWTFRCSLLSLQTVVSNIFIGMARNGSNTIVAHVSRADR